MQHTDEELNGPDLQKAVKTLPSVMAHLDATMLQTQGAVTNVNHSTKQLDDKLTQMMKPASFARRVLVGLIDAGQRAMGWIGALK